MTKLFKMKDYNLYHYSSEPRNILKTLEKAGNLSPKDKHDAVEFNKDVKGPGPYFSHISFFFDPIPSVLLGKIFGDGHKAWYNGNVMYEHVVNIVHYTEKFVYLITETPSTLKKLDETDWEDSHEFLVAYLLESHRLQRKNKEISDTIKDLKGQIDIYRGRTEEFYLKAFKRDDFKENFDKYAASVPHVMFYPKRGLIITDSINKVTIGKEKRIKVR